MNVKGPSSSRPEGDEDTASLRRPTVRAIAALADVSQTTVSLALNNAIGVNLPSPIRERVLAYE